MITSQLVYENIDTKDIVKHIRSRIKDIYYDIIKDKKNTYSVERYGNGVSNIVVYSKTDSDDKYHYQYRLEYEINPAGHHIRLLESSTPLIHHVVSKKISATLSGQWEDFQKEIGRLNHRWLSSLWYKESQLIVE